ncbi:FecR domain-containing protein [Herbaspirillum sp. WKF16]|uniref:FecR domain-containing protein n=1 Tax=Herbaspirillum sp. WKF16 TaxID=3028312 RepID=UPI0023A9DE88|nr:FecR domain-containing protein [Herbaspirillum sp. WKF16]WDZ94218.1 FecR domain-containing protein [Herbaspirillum sp. WKF16]
MQDRLQLHRPQESPPPPALDPGPSYAELQQAAEWFAILRADDAGEPERLRWRQWLERDERHRAAWKRVEAVNAEFGLMPPAVGHRVLAQNGQRRRKAIKALAWLAAGVMVAGGAGSSRELRGYLAALNARYRTGVGQIERQQLADGSLLWLNTASAADADYSDVLRRLILHRGEIMIQTAHDGRTPARPLVVDVPAGRLQALGTRFLVRLEEHGATLTVLEGKVMITPAGGGAPTLIGAGWRVRFDAGRVDAATPADESMAAWSRKLLMPDGMRLDEFLAELGRYRRGYLGCAPEVAALRLVGVYPLDDTERVLNALEASLPVKVHRILPWWVTVDAAEAAGAARKPG